jgi:hypothetical protein
LRTALLQPGSLTLLLSPSLRQSAELHRKVQDLYRALGRPVPLAGPRDNTLKTELANGSRVVSLPGVEATVRGYSGTALLIVDEAARVDDGLYFSIRPMLAVSRGRLIALSTAYAKRGWFYDTWVGTENWQRVKVTADQCPRISPDFLEEERAAFGTRIFQREYECTFSDADDAVFAEADLRRMLDTDALPLFATGA